jgi:hypothetical protein
MLKGVEARHQWKSRALGMRPTARTATAGRRRPQASTPQRGECHDGLGVARVFPTLPSLGAALRRGGSPHPARTQAIRIERPANAYDKDRF